MLDSGDQEASYAQIEDSIRNHIGVRFLKDVMPESSEQKPIIDDLVHLESSKRHHHGHKSSHKHKHHKTHKHANQKIQSDSAKPATHAQPPKTQNLVSEKS